VETPRKFITAKLLIIFFNLRGVSTNKTIIYFIAMQTYKELVILLFIYIYIYKISATTQQIPLGIFITISFVPQDVALIR
jgi:hypothetical protein